jgi:gas vesicle protein
LEWIEINNHRLKKAKMNQGFSTESSPLLMSTPGAPHDPTVPFDGDSSPPAVAPNQAPLAIDEYETCLLTTGINYNAADNNGLKHGTNDEEADAADSPVDHDGNGYNQQDVVNMNGVADAYNNNDNCDCAAFSNSISNYAVPVLLGAGFCTHLGESAGHSGMGSTTFFTAASTVAYFKVNQKFGQVQGQLQRDITQAKEVLKGEIAEVKEELKGEISQVKEELKGGIAQLKEELKGDISQVNVEVKGELSQVKEELKGDIAQVKEELKEEITKVSDQVEQVLRLMQAQASAGKLQPTSGNMGKK